MSDGVHILFKFNIVSQLYIYIYTHIYIYIHIYMYIKSQRGTRWRRKVAGSIPDGLIGIFDRHNPSGRTMALGLTQLPTEMSTRNICGAVKAVGA